MEKRGGIFVFGAGGHGKVVLDILLESGISVSGFLDDDKKIFGRDIMGFKVLGDMSFAKNTSKIALGIGNNKIRSRVFCEAKKKGIDVISAIHPKSVISRSVKMGEGVVVMAGAVINPYAVLSEGVVVNTGASVDHDCRLKRFCQIWPGANLAGNVKVGDFSYVGTGAAVIQNINIGKDVMIGAGAAVISDIPDRATAVGVPAKIVKENSK